MGVRFEDDVLELARIAQAAYHANSHLVGLLRVRGWLPKLAGGDLDILLLERVADGCRQPALRGRDAVLHVDRGDVEVVAGLEGDGDAGGAVVGGGGGHVTHALDAIDGLFENGGDGRLYVLRVGADVIGAHHDLRRRKLRIERDRQRGYADRAREHDKQRAD